jgi:hypothetical protein
MKFRWWAYGGGIYAVYEPARGVPDMNIPPGTSFDDLPHSFFDIFYSLT